MSKHLNISDKHWTICNAHVGRIVVFSALEMLLLLQKQHCVFFYFDKLGTSTC